MVSSAYNSSCIIAPITWFSSSSSSKSLSRCMSWNITVIINKNRYGDNGHPCLIPVSWVFHFEQRHDRYVCRVSRARVFILFCSDVARMTRTPRHAYRVMMRVPKQHPPLLIERTERDSADRYGRDIVSPTRH